MAQQLQKEKRHCLNAKLCANISYGKSNHDTIFRFRYRSGIDAVYLAVH